jgi:chromosome segregation ATPase
VSEELRSLFYLAVTAGLFVGGIIVAMMRSKTRQELAKTNLKADSAETEAQNAKKVVNSMLERFSDLEGQNDALQTRVVELESERAATRRELETEKAARQTLVGEVEKMRQNVNDLLAEKRTLTAERDEALKRAAESEERFRELDRRVLVLEGERKAYETILTSEREQLTRVLTLVEALVTKQATPVIVPVVEPPGVTLAPHPSVSLKPEKESVP